MAEENSFNDADMVCDIYTRAYKKMLLLIENDRQPSHITILLLLLIKLYENHIEPIYSPDYSFNSNAARYVIDKLQPTILKIVEVAENYIGLFDLELRINFIYFSSMVLKYELL